jgi:hypothetical protein
MYFAQAELLIWNSGTSGTGFQKPGMLTVKLRNAYYFGVDGKCNFFVAEGIAVAF